MVIETGGKARIRRSGAEVEGVQEAGAEDTVEGFGVEGVEVLDGFGTRRTGCGGSVR